MKVVESTSPMAQGEKGIVVYKAKSNKTVAAKSRKITSVEELANACGRGLKVYCPDDLCFEKPSSQPNMVGLSVRYVMKMIDKGMYAIDDEDQAPVGSMLAIQRERIRATGMSHDEIAAIVGVSRQAVQKFMKATSVQTRVLDNYLTKLGLL